VEHIKEKSLLQDLPDGIKKNGELKKEKRPTKKAGLYLDLLKEYLKPPLLL